MNGIVFIEEDEKKISRVKKAKFLLSFEKKGLL